MKQQQQQQGKNNHTKHTKAAIRNKPLEAQIENKNNQKTNETHKPSTL